MNTTLIISISILAIFDLSLMNIISWAKARNNPFYFWFGCLFFSSSTAILNNLLIFTNNENIIIYHCAVAINLSYGGYLISFIRSLRKTEITQIYFDWKLFIPTYIYVPFIILTLLQPHWIYEALQLAKVGKMNLFGTFYNMIICLYSISSNVVLLVQEYRFRSEPQCRTNHPFIKEILWTTLILQLFAFLPFLFNLDIRWIIMYMPVFGQLFFLYIFFRLLVNSKQFINDLTIKYASTNLTDDKTDSIKQQIISYMTEQKPYLNMDYSLSEMSKDLKILPNHLSMVINSRLNCSFPEYINSLRIKTAIKLLEEASKKNMTIEAIAYESGFNNRTSFYTAFKKETGKTPSEFTKTQGKKNTENLTAG